MCCTPSALMPLHCTVLLRVLLDMRQPVRCASHSGRRTSGPPVKVPAVQALRWACCEIGQAGAVQQPPSALLCGPLWCWLGV